MQSMRRWWMLTICFCLISAILAESPRDIAFQKADLNQNGVLDRDEFESYTQSIASALIPFGLVDQVPVEGRVDGGNERHQQEPRHGSPIALAGTGFWSGFGSSFGTILATEIGDKTFFIAAIMSMRHERLVVFASAWGALIIMTILSVALGGVVGYFLPKDVTHYIGTFLFVFFGAKMLKEGYDIKSYQPSEELAEVEEELEGKKDRGEAEGMEEGEADDLKKMDLLKVMTQGFVLTFLAEWGDRSQIATITLSTSKDPLGVTLGGIMGHALCTGMAVVGGKLLASRISEKTVHLAGGVIFMLFAVHSMWTGP